MKKIKLLTNYSSPLRHVSQNQIASFEDAEADQLLKLGYAELIEVIEEAQIIEPKKDLEIDKQDQKEDQKEDPQDEIKEDPIKPLETADLKPAEQKLVKGKASSIFKK